MEGRRPILCAQCGVGPGRPFEREGAMWARCPLCGQEALVSDIQREAVEQHLYVSRRANGTVTARLNEPRSDYRWTLWG